MVPKGKRGKMILLLMIMTPGIPEYLTGSSSFYSLFTNFPNFVLGLLLNAGLYTTGALLIREFMVRFNKGWISVLILGCAYGIMEEGIAVHTFFEVSGQPVGLLAIYGRYAGVNWVWALGLTFFHAVFSIFLPLLLLSLAYPEHSNEPLLGKRGISAVLFIYALDVLILNLLLLNSPGRPVPTLLDYLFFLAISSILVLLSYKIKSNFPKLRGRAGKGAKKFYMLGLLVFLLYSLYAFFPVRNNGTYVIPPVLDMLFLVAVYSLILFATARSMPGESNEKEKLYLAIGLITPLLGWSVLMEMIGLTPLIMVVTAIAIVFLYKLKKMMKSRNMMIPQPVQGGNR